MHFVTVQRLKLLSQGILQFPEPQTPWLWSCITHLMKSLNLVEVYSIYMKQINYLSSTVLCRFCQISLSGCVENLLMNARAASENYVHLKFQSRIRGKTSTLLPLARLWPRGFEVNGGMWPLLFILLPLPHLQGMACLWDFSSLFIFDIMGIRETSGSKRDGRKYLM